MRAVVRLERIARPIAAACAALVLLAYAARAAALVRYPWDWSPDEGLFVDYARRLVEAPATLYPKQVVPYPAIYGPLIAVMLAPIVALFDPPLPAARVLEALWVAAGGLAIVVLVRRRAGVLAGTAALALSLAAFDVSFWHMLVRPDTPMLALLLLAACALLPARLERGADRLTARRLALGAVALLAAFLFKGTALLQGAPLVASWLLVDRRSALRLIALVGVAALASVALLELMTGGGFSWSQRLFAVHPYYPWQIGVILKMFVARTWPVLALVALAFADAARRGARPWRDGSLALIAGGLTTIPALAKSGAYFNYLLPLLSALVIAGGRWLGDGEGEGDARASARSVIGATVASAAALALALTTAFPLPSPRQEATATFFYGFVRDAVASERTPILAIAPDYAYVVARQPLEMEATGLVFLLAGTEGVDVIVERLLAARYGLVIEGPWRLDETPSAQRLFARYEPVGECRLGSFLGPLPYRLSLRRGTRLKFLPPAGTDCRATPAPS